MAARHLSLALAVTALTACGNHYQGVSVPSGQGSVTGAALSVPFNFAAVQVTALIDATHGPNVLIIQMCEFGCEPMGTQIASDSRAVSLTVRANPADLHNAVQFAIGTQFAAMAISRFSDTTNNFDTTKVDVAQSGQIVFETLDARANGQIKGSFDLAMQRGGALHGTFEAPVSATGTPAP